MTLHSVTEIQGRKIKAYWFNIIPATKHSVVFRTLEDLQENVNRNNSLEDSCWMQLKTQKEKIKSKHYVIYYLFSMLVNYMIAATIFSIMKHETLPTNSINENCKTYCVHVFF